MSARDASGSAPQHSHPHNNTMSRNEKFWVDQVTVPHPPPGNDKGWGTTPGGGGGTREDLHCTCTEHTLFDYQKNTQEFKMRIFYEPEKQLMLSKNLFLPPKSGNFFLRFFWGECPVLRPHHHLWPETLCNFSYFCKNKFLREGFFVQCIHLGNT